MRVRQCACWPADLPSTAGAAASLLIELHPSRLLTSLPPQPAPAPHAGLSRSDPDSPSKFAEALLGREFNSKVGACSCGCRCSRGVR